MNQYKLIIPTLPILLTTLPVLLNTLPYTLYSNIDSDNPSLLLATILTIPSDQVIFQLITDSMILVKYNHLSTRKSDLNLYLDVQASPIP